MKAATVWAAGAGLALLLAAAGGAVYFARSRTPEAMLSSARRYEARQTPRLAALRSSGRPEDMDKAAALVEQVAAKYLAVTERHRSSTEAAEADFRLYELRDEATTEPLERVAMLRAFLERHPDSSLRPDLEWKLAGILHRDAKAFVDAVKAYEAFARDHPKDGRAAEALFRAAAIYEEISEHAAALKAYERVVQEYPGSRFAEEAQFRRGTILAERMEKRQEAAEAFGQLERDHPGGRLAAAAGGQRRRLAEATAADRKAEYSRGYYGGVSEMNQWDRASSELSSPLAARLRAQGTNLLHQQAEVRLDPPRRLAEATATLTLAWEQGPTDTLVLQLGAGLEASNISWNGSPAPHKHQGNFLLLDLAGVADGTAGATESVTISYGGVCRDTWSGDVISTDSAHLISRNYLPALSFGDAFTADLRVTVPEGYEALTQGEPIARESAGGWTVFRFAQDTPVYFYALAVARYASRTATYQPADDGHPVPLRVCLFPDTDQAYFDTYTRALPDILAFFESRLGQYP